MWLKESNRLEHFKYAIPAAFLLSLPFALGLGIGMEFKDKQYGNKFDWLDVLATALGGLIGQVLRVVLSIPFIQLLNTIFPYSIWKSILEVILLLDI